MSAQKFLVSDYVDHVAQNHIDFVGYHAAAPPRPPKSDLVITLKLKHSQRGSNDDYPCFKSTLLNDSKIDLYKKLALKMESGGSLFNDQFAYLRILHVAMNVETFCCTLCPKVYNNLQSLKRHMVRHHLVIKRGVLK